MQKPPGNLVFLEEKPLDLVLSLDFAFSSVLGVLYVHTIIVTRRIVLDQFCLLFLCIFVLFLSVSLCLHVCLCCCLVFGHVFVSRR